MYIWNNKCYIFHFEYVVPVGGWMPKDNIVGDWILYVNKVPACVFADNSREHLPPTLTKKEVRV